jgi:alpha-1,6-mannosyltransferase
VNRAVVKLTGLGVLLLALMAGALQLHIPGTDSIGSATRANTFVGVLGVGLAVYLVAVRLIQRTALPPRAIWIVLGIAAIMRVVLLPAPPFLSSDIYRYVWDGQVQAAGINPYRYVPADPALADLRDPAVFPLINRATYARTIYPPAAELIFAAVGRLTRTVIGMKIAMLAFEIVAVLCMLRLLAIARLPPTRILIYAWNPLVVWSFACDGHIDAAAIGLLAVALLCRAQRRDGLAGAALAAAMLVKFLPIVVAPAFVRGGRLWRPLLAGAVVMLLLYGLYISAGSHVLGFLPTYGSEEGLDDGTGFWLLAGLAHLFPLPSDAVAVYMIAVIAGFAWLALWIARRRPTSTTNDAVLLCRDTAILAACATVAISPHYPWYFAWLALPCIVAPIPAVLWLSAAPVMLHADPFHDRFYWPTLVYLPAAGLALFSLRRSCTVPHAAVAAPEGTP